MSRLFKTALIAMIVFSFLVNLYFLATILIPELAPRFNTSINLSNIKPDDFIVTSVSTGNEISLNHDAHLNTDTILVLTGPVPLQVKGQINTDTVTFRDVDINLTLPAGLILPVHLDLDVPIRGTLPIVAVDDP